MIPISLDLQLKNQTQNYITKTHKFLAQKFYLQMMLKNISRENFQAPAQAQCAFEKELKGYASKLFELKNKKFTLTKPESVSKRYQVSDIKLNM
jgi:hypothetical protein